MIHRWITGISFTTLIVTMAVGGCSRLPPQPDQAMVTPPALSTPYVDPEATVVPIGLRIPAIGVNSHDPWIPLGLDDKEQIKVPNLAHPLALGWYCPMATSDDPDPVDCGAPEPGRVGPAVVLGHINGGGHDGIFARLAHIKVGDTVAVDRANGTTATFRITRVQTVDKTSFPTSPVYADVAYPAIRLISCGGRLDKVHHRYLDQVIAFGDLTEMQITR